MQAARWDSLRDDGDGGDGDGGDGDGGDGDGGDVRPNSCCVTGVVGSEA